MANTGTTSISRYTKKSGMKKLKTPSSRSIRMNARKKAMEGVNKIHKTTKSMQPKSRTAMEKLSSMTGVKMPTSRKQLTSTTTSNSNKIKTAAKKAVKNWSSQNKGMSTAMRVIKKARTKSGMSSTGLYSRRKKG